MKAVFDKNYVRLLDGPNVKKGKNKMDLAEQVREDIRNFRKSSGASRLVMMWCGSTESFTKPSEVHSTVKAFEKGLTTNDENIAPSQIYAYAAMMEKRALRERCAEPDGGHPGHPGALTANMRAHLRQGLQDRSDADEDHSRARL